MNIRGLKNCKAVSVSTAAVALSTLKTRSGLVIRNNSANTIYLGNSSSVTTATGFPLLASEVMEDNDSYDTRSGIVDDWYAIAASASDVRVIEYS
jgi:hypothetical protein